MNPTLAIAVTYHNEKELLTFCLESLLAQTPRPTEILIHDDASEFPPSDYLPKENFGVEIRVIRSESVRGPAKGRNVLWRATVCDYVHFHDSDDWFDAKWSGALARMMGQGFGAIFTEVNSHRDGKIFRENILGLADPVARSKETDADPDFFTRFCLGHAMLVPSGTYRRDLLVKLSGYRETLWQSEDFDFHVRLAAANPRLAFIADPLVHIRLRNESRSQNQDQVWESRLESLERLSIELPKKFYPDLSEAMNYAGSQLFRLKKRELAKRAFALAKRLAKTPAVRFSRQRPLYRAVAQGLGPQTAEWLGLAYRGIVPARVRAWLRGKR